MEELEFALDFGQNGDSDRFCAAGWSAVEPDERWAIGTESRITLPAPSTPGDYFLMLKFRPLVVPGRISGQKLYVNVNGTTVGEFFASERADRVCHLPWQLLEGSSYLDIAFRTPDAAAPAAFAPGGDDRTLAIAFNSLRLFRDRYARPADGDAVNVLQARAPRGDHAALGNTERLPARDLMLRFESLGQNCEFGLVQRRCEVEPLGLLRFASTPLANLLSAFEGDFAGLGAADAIEVLPSDNHTEYMVGTRFGLFYHAWVKIGEMTAEDVHRRETRRVPILVRKLTQELRSGEKIFVFRGMGALPEEEVMPLFAELRRFGPNTLLFVTLADAAHRSGTVERRRPDFLVGYIERFAPSEDAYDLLLDDWVTICWNAYSLRLQTRR
jgi:hypothetical protein